jgi:hypothetical protein
LPPAAICGSAAHKGSIKKNPPKRDNMRTKPNAKIFFLISFTPLHLSIKGGVSNYLKIRNFFSLLLKKKPDIANPNARLNIIFSTPPPPKKRG